AIDRLLAAPFPPLVAVVKQHAVIWGMIFLRGAERAMVPVFGAGAVQRRRPSKLPGQVRLFAHRRPGGSGEGIRKFFIDESHVVAFAVRVVLLTGENVDIEVRAAIDAVAAGGENYIVLGGGLWRRVQAARVAAKPAFVEPLLGSRFEEARVLI